MLVHALHALYTLVRRFAFSRLKRLLNETPIPHPQSNSTLLCAQGLVTACLDSSYLWLLPSRPFAATYRPRDRLLLAGGAFGSALVTHTRCLRMLEVTGSCIISCCLTCQMSPNERARDSSERKTITPASYDEETLSTNKS